MKNTFLQKLRQGEPCLGTFSYLATGNAVEALSYTGLDFLIFDAEHGTVQSETAEDLIRAAKLHGLTPLVRTQDTSRSSLLKMLEAGAHGLVVPQLHTLEQARSLVRDAKYFPIGMRGVAIGCSGGYGYEPFAAQGLQNYFDVCNRETLLFPQCETRGCLESIEAIVQLEGIDGIFVGPYDLSVALGQPGRFDTEEFQNAVARILAAAKEAGKRAIMYTVDPAQAPEFFQRGFDAVTLGTDLKLMISQLRPVVKRAKEVMPVK